MTERTGSFSVGLDFEHVLRAISKQIYETPLAFIRENVQNAVDAVRIQALRDGVSPADPRYRIDVHIEPHRIRVKDNGIGMSSEELERLFWTIGASGKRTEEAASAGCVGMFGIGGFANFGVCDTLEVVSQTADAAVGTLTRLSADDIRRSGASIPKVTVEDSDLAAPRGTLVIGTVREQLSVEGLAEYLRDFVKFVPSTIVVNDRVMSGQEFADPDDRERWSAIKPPCTWRGEDLAIHGQMFESPGHSLMVRISGLTVRDTPIHLRGMLRFESGAIDVYKRGFKLCATQVGSTIGVGGRLDCDQFVPTAGRDSLDSGTSTLLHRIVRLLERAAVEAVLESSERIAQHTRVFRYINGQSMTELMGNVQVRLADGTDVALSELKERVAAGRGQVFFGAAQKQALNQIMQTRGHWVVLLAGDRQRQVAERRYLERYCGGKAFDGMIDCVERYADLSRFEKLFLGELELSISRAYEVKNVELIPGKLTEDIPVFVKEQLRAGAVEVFVDVRHPEVAKLERLGFTQLMYSLIGTFCQEYLGPSLKKWSPRFFGDGALNLELFAKRRSELWILLKDDIEVVRRGGQRQVVTRSDVAVVSAGKSASVPQRPDITGKARLLHIVDGDAAVGIGGYYIRLPEAANRAYGDLLPQCETRGVVWAGNKITYIASDAVSAAFQYEIRVDEVVIAAVEGERRAEGAIELERPLQELFGGVYFPIPEVLERYLVPKGDTEIRLDLRCDWIDMRTARQWSTKDEEKGE